MPEACQFGAYLVIGERNDFDIQLASSPAGMRTQADADSVEGPGGGKAISGSFPYFDFQNGGSREGIFEGECDGSPESQKVALVAVHLSQGKKYRNQYLPA